MPISGLVSARRSDSASRLFRVHLPRTRTEVGNHDLTFLSLNINGHEASDGLLSQKLVKCRDEKLQSLTFTSKAGPLDHHRLVNSQMKLEQIFLLYIHCHYTELESCCAFFILSLFMRIQWLALGYVLSNVMRFPDELPTELDLISSDNVLLFYRFEYVFKFFDCYILKVHKFIESARHQYPIRVVVPVDPELFQIFTCSISPSRGCYTALKGSGRPRPIATAFPSRSAVAASKVWRNMEYRWIDGITGCLWLIVTGCRGPHARISLRMLWCQFPRCRFAVINLWLLASLF